MTAETDALFRLPLVYQLDRCISSALADSYNYYFIPAIIQDLIAVPVIFVLIIFTCVLITWRNQFIMTYYCSLFSSFCIFASFNVSLQFAANAFSSESSQLSYVSILYQWVSSAFVLMFAGCFLTMSYISNPLVSAHYCPIGFFVVFVPTMLFSFLGGYLQVFVMILFYIIVPLAPVYWMIQREGREYWTKLKMLFQLSGANGHVEFLAGYLLANVEKQFIYNILILYWCCNQGESKFVLFWRWKVFHTVSRYPGVSEVLK